MKTYRIALLAAAAVMLAIPAHAQTAGELLQKGIYTQDTAGDLDGAIAIYRQIVNSGNSPRDIAAQAQYRLAQAMLAKGDLANGATEFSNLARNYADYAKLISRLVEEANRSVNLRQPGAGGRGNLNATLDAAQLQDLKAMVERLKTADGGGRGGRGGLSEQTPAEQQAKLAEALSRLKASAELAQRDRQNRVAAITPDSSSPVTVKGVVLKFEMLTSNSLLSVEAEDSTKRYTFLLNTAALNWKRGPIRQAVRPGDEMTITGFLATFGPTMPDGTIAAVASTITSENGEKIYDSGQVTQ